jgi:hypothetical protein
LRPQSTSKHVSGVVSVDSIRSAIKVRVEIFKGRASEIME